MATVAARYLQQVIANLRLSDEKASELIERLRDFLRKGKKLDTARMKELRESRRNKLAEEFLESNAGRSTKVGDYFWPINGAPPALNYMKSVRDANLIKVNLGDIIFLDVGSVPKRLTQKSLPGEEAGGVDTPAEEADSLDQRHAEQVRLLNTRFEEIDGEFMAQSDYVPDTSRKTRQQATFTNDMPVDITPTRQNPPNSSVQISPRRDVAPVLAKTGQAKFDGVQFSDPEESSSSPAEEIAYAAPLASAQSLGKRKADDTDTSSYPTPNSTTQAVRMGHASSEIEQNPTKKVHIGSHRLPWGITATTLSQNPSRSPTSTSDRVIATSSTFRSSSKHLISPSGNIGEVPSLKPFRISPPAVDFDAMLATSSPIQTSGVIHSAIQTDPVLIRHRRYQVSQLVRLPDAFLDFANKRAEKLVEEAEAATDPAVRNAKHVEAEFYADVRVEFETLLQRISRDARA